MVLYRRKKIGGGLWDASDIKADLKMAFTAGTFTQKGGYRTNNIASMFVTKKG